MTGVVVVDWLGRGGIAQCSEAWGIELRDAGVHTTIVTRPGRELGSGVVKVDAAPEHSNRVAAQRAVATHAARVIERERPATVIVQNYVIPHLERPVYRAARRVGARLVVVVHDQRLHSRWAGSSAGLRGLLQGADDIVTHSHWVAEAVQATTRREVEVIPVPVPVGLLAASRRHVPFPVDRSRMLALHFGVLHRAYKGSSTVVELARSAPPGWDIAAVGVGAPRAQGLIGVDRFLEPGELVASVEAAQATLLPYRLATQSGAVVLAQALGSVPVVTAVGGIPEQLVHGLTGILLPADSPVASWSSALDELSDGQHRKELVTAGQEKAWADHARFRKVVVALTGRTGTKQAA